MKIMSELPDSVDPVLAFGVHDSNLRLLERLLQVKIHPNAQGVTIEGDDNTAAMADMVLHHIYQLAKARQPISHHDIKILIDESGKDKICASPRLSTEGLQLSRKGNRLKPRNTHQAEYLEKILTHDLVFAVGPAGTGKTYLAMGLAMHLLYTGRVSKVILTRPVVEAGENLGFLPGTLEEKIDPYLRPLFDAMNEMLSPDELKMHMENQTIELAPLAYMRGRTLSNAFIILDEAQNTTTMQMKMFLTRLGENSKMVVTGDITQIDLPYGRESGLKQAVELFSGLDEIRFVQFTQEDVVRHGLVKKILDIYEKRENTAWKELTAG